MNTKRAYLGDGVYAAVCEFGGMLLTTENGVEATNSIVLEPEVISALIRWLTQNCASTHGTEQS